MDIMKYWDTWISLLFFVVFLVITVVYRNRIGKAVQLKHNLDSDRDVEEYFSDKQEKNRIIFFAFLCISFVGIIASLFIDL